MICVMLLMFRKLFVNLVGCRRKFLKVECVKRFSGIWLMKVGGSRCRTVVIRASV